MGGTQIRQAIQRWRKASRLTYRQIAILVGCSPSHARKMGCGAIGQISPQLAKRFEEASGGVINAEELVFPERFRDGKRKRGAA